MTNTRPRWVLGLTSTAYFMVVLDSLVVVTALPRMQQELHADLAPCSGRSTPTASPSPPGSSPPRRSATGSGDGGSSLGLALFALSSAACALAPTAAELIVARTVQGLGAAAVLPLSLTILTGAFPPHGAG
jgi:hypothetical protein